MTSSVYSDESLYSFPPLGAPNSKPAEVTPLDHHIASAGGTTSTIECLPHRLKISKQYQPATVAERLEELTRENGYLRQELASQKEIMDAMMGLHEKVVDAYRLLKVGLQILSLKREQSDESLLAYWGIKEQHSEVKIL